MRFHGQVRFQDLETADLDVAVEVDDTHVRLLSGGESLGRWCLADVTAHRVVANEFELDLGGETVRFLAADQVNFAYGAVQDMAESWARYHSMNVVRRARAVAAARKRNEPSRLLEVFEAFAAAAPALVSEDADAERSEDSPSVEGRQLTDVDESSEDDTATAPGPFWQKVEQARMSQLGADAASLTSPSLVSQSPPSPHSPEPHEPADGRPPAAEPPVSQGMASGSDPYQTPPTDRSAGPRTEGIYFKPRVEGEGNPGPDPQSGPTEYADGRHPAETSGLRASVRSIFGKSKSTPHEHVFVESTTAVGLMRRVCIDCGYVSIGVAPD